MTPVRQLPTVVHGEEQPFVVRGGVSHWPALRQWSLAGLSQTTTLGVDRLVTAQFARMDDSNDAAVGRGELDRARRLVDLATFVKSFVLERQAMHGFTRELHWGYLSYCYLRELLGEDEPCDAVDWSAFDGDARPIDSTLWIGTRGAFTPTHFDSYGCNWVAQIDGRKRWRLFAPDAADMPPTRVPFEESTVWLAKPLPVPCAGGFEVVLEPGDVLFVPHHWWHQVDSLTDSVSANLWVRHAADAAEAQLEALARALVERIVAGLPIDSELALVNPSEDEGNVDDNLADVSDALALERPLTLALFTAAALSDAVAAAMASVPTTPPRTAEQLRDALRSRLAGQAATAAADAVPHAQLVHVATHAATLRALQTAVRHV